MTRPERRYAPGHEPVKVPWTDGLGDALLIFAAGLLIALGFLFL